jgi:LacI family transcriptional regulator
MAVTIRDVAKLAEASVASVSATLNGTRSTSIRVGHETRERIYAAAATLGYVSNPVARSLSTGKSRVIGLMLPYVEAFTDHNPFCAQVTNGVLEEAVRRHYNLMLYSGAVPNGLQTSMPNARVDGVVMVMPEPDSPALLRCESRRIPYVSVLRDPLPNTYTVNSNDFVGGYEATKHLINLGHRRIAHLVGEVTVCTSGPRLQGYRAALKEAGIAYDPSIVLQGGFDWSGGYREAANLLAMERPLRPTAVFAANDLCASGVLRACRERRVSVPDELSIVGYDDTFFASMTQPELTSVHMPLDEMGALAVHMLVDLVEGRPVAEPHPVLPIRLTVRASCGSNDALTHSPSNAHS